MPGSRFTLRHLHLVAPRLIAGCALLSLPISSCSPSVEASEALKPLYARESCNVCDSTPNQLAGILPPPPPREEVAAPERQALGIGRHRVLYEVRSFEGVPAAGVRVELWEHPLGHAARLAGTAQTDVNGIAAVPFDGRGVFCFHASHPEAGATEMSPRQFRLFGKAADFPVELVLPQSDVIIPRAGVVQVGVAGPEGQALPRTRVAVWRHNFREKEPTLAGTGVTDSSGVVRIELERPGIYSVAAEHADFGRGAHKYEWFVPRSTLGEGRVAVPGDDWDDRELQLAADLLAEDAERVVCDVHLRLGEVAEGEERADSTPFHVHNLSAEDDVRVTEHPQCCLRWARPKQLTTLAVAPGSPQVTPQTDLHLLNGSSIRTEAERVEAMETIEIVRRKLDEQRRSSGSHGFGVETRERNVRYKSLLLEPDPH